MKFIIADPKDDGPWPLYAGVIGPIGPSNVYLTAYAKYPTSQRPSDLNVGESIIGVQFSLSGQRNTYTIRRVE